MGNNDKRPKIRFKGFNDDWEQHKLNEISQRVQNNDGRMNLPTLTISAANGWMNQQDRFYGNIAGKEQKNYTLLSKGELSYNHGNSKLAKYGAVFVLRTYEEALVPRVYHSFKIINGIPDFIEYYFATKIPDIELAKIISSGARMDGLLNISYDEFSNIKFKLPSEKEQFIISSFLRKLDSLIALHQRKLEKLGNIKKSMLEKMFPKDENKVPEIRFKGFNDDWEQHKLGDIAEFYNGDRSSRYPNDSDIVSDGIPFINAGDLVSGHVKLDTANKITEKKYNELSGAKIQLGDIIYCLRGTLGKNAFVDNFDIGTVASSLVDIRPKEIVGKFLFQVLNSDIEFRQRILNDEGAAQPNLSAKNLSMFEIPNPSRAEQIKVAEYFENLDNIISLHQRKPIFGNGGN